MFAPESERPNKQKVFENYLDAKVSEPIYFGDILEKTEVSKDEFVFIITFKREDGKIKVMETPPYQP